MMHNNNRGTTVLVTGANGFVGRHLCRALVELGIDVRAAVRRSDGAEDMKRSGCRVVQVGDIGPDTDWSDALAEADGVVHLAARVHNTREGAEALETYFRVNTEGTRRLAEAAGSAGVRRLVFLSSIKVNGDETSDNDGLFRESDVPAPVDSYGRSKWEAEQALLEVARKSDLEVVIVRSPLVYGPGVKANFLALMRAIDRRWPLPLGAIRNARSLIYVGNLVGALIRCLTHPAAAGHTYLVSDGEDLSTPDLVRRLAKALGRSAPLIPVPVRLLRLGAALAGKDAAIRRLAGSLRIDSAAIQRGLDWRPPYSVDEGLRTTAKAFLRVSGDE